MVGLGRGVVGGAAAGIRRFRATARRLCGLPVVAIGIVTTWKRLLATYLDSAGTSECVDRLNILRRPSHAPGWAFNSGMRIWGFLRHGVGGSSGWRPGDIPTGSGSPGHPDVGGPRRWWIRRDNRGRSSADPIVLGTIPGSTAGRSAGFAL